jgi:cytoskeletal protein CcmA (bactofilin family)
MWPFRDPKTAIPTFEVENTIGAGSRVRGDLSGSGGFRIDGTVEGGITADGPVVIGEGGSVEGAVRGRDVVVLGRVRGDVHVSGHLEIGPKGKVLGDITVQSFRMHTGGVFRGLSCMPGEEDAAAPALLFGVASTSTELETRVRTLPPPNGAVVPPPPALAELAELATARSSDVTDEAVSQQRLITTAAATPPLPSPLVSPPLVSPPLVSGDADTSRPRRSAM